MSFTFKAKRLVQDKQDERSFFYYFPYKLGTRAFLSRHMEDIYDAMVEEVNGTGVESTNTVIALLFPYYVPFDENDLEQEMQEEEIAGGRFERVLGSFSLLLRTDINSLNAFDVIIQIKFFTSNFKNLHLTVTEKLIRNFQDVVSRIFKPLRFIIEVDQGTALPFGADDPNLFTIAYSEAMETAENPVIGGSK